MKTGRRLTESKNMNESDIEQPNFKEMAEHAIDVFHAREVEKYKRGEMPAVLKNIKEGAVTREQITRVMTTRYQAAHFFEDMLKRIIQNIRSAGLSSEIQTPLVQSVEQNLREELGEAAAYGGPHREGREVLLKALGVDYEEWRSKLGTYNELGNLDPAAGKLIESLRKITDENPITAVALLYYYEDRISLDGEGDYHVLLGGLEKLFPELSKETYVEGDALWHVSSHADHDVHHAALAKDALTHAVRNQIDIASLEKGLSETKSALDAFWNELGQEIKNTL